jgi:hypothetical protein
MTVTDLREGVFCLARLIISDVDGTITRSDILGHVLPRVGLDWSHYGINKLFTNIRANGYEIMFLSSRAIAQVTSMTRVHLILLPTSLCPPTACHNLTCMYRYSLFSRSLSIQVCPLSRMWLKQSTSGS